METSAKFLESKPETSDATSFLFAKPTGFEFQAGQFMFFTLPHEGADERGVRRHFTISSSPTEEHLMFTTKFSDPGSSYKHAFKVLAGGTEVAVRGPHGEFTLPADTSQPLVFLGGGIGITPFRSMAKFAADTARPTPITLIYANKSPADIVYRGEFDQWTKVNPNFKAVYTVDNPDQGWTGTVGHLSAELITKNVTDLKGTVFLVCGPAGMIEAYTSILSGIGVGPDQVRTENFSGY